jgi:hypothetical protein
MSEQYADSAQTTLNGAITSAQTTLTVASAAGLPSVAPFRILIDNELMIVTAGAGTTTWTVTRGAEGTTAAAHSNGATVTQVLTAQGLANVTGGINAQTGTSYTIATTDARQLVTFSNGSPVAVTLPQATSGDNSNFHPHWWTAVLNRGAGTVTITPTTSTINGVASLAMAQNQWAIIWSDGTNYQALVSTSSGSGITKGGIYCLGLAYVSSSSISVAAGQARDSGDTTNLVLSALQTISTGTLGSINGLDRVTIPSGGTVATSTSNANVTGTGTAFFTDFAPNSTPRALTGTVSSSGTTVTGTGTLFLSQVSVGDLIGNSATGYYRVTAIASNTSLTIVSAPGTAFSGASVNLIENAHFQCNSQTVQRINTITSNTALTLAASSSATVASGGTAYAGALPSVQVPMHVWLGTGTTGTGVWLSTQRTTAFGILGYATAYRRIGSIIWTGSAIVAFDQWGYGIERWYQCEDAKNANGEQLLSGGSATSWTTLTANTVAPPTATALLLTLGTNAVSSTLYVRARNTGDATTTRNTLAGPNGRGSSACTSAVEQACDGAQAIDYVVASSSLVVDVFVRGYRESLA